MEIPFRLLEWKNNNNLKYNDYFPFAERGTQRQWVSIQGDKENQWFGPNDDQMDAIKKFESEIRWLIQISEGPREKGQFKLGNYVIYCNRNASSYYIGQPGGRKRKVLLIPTHSGAKKHATMESQIAQKVGSLGYNF